MNDYESEKVGELTDDVVRIDDIVLGQSFVDGNRFGNVVHVDGGCLNFRRSISIS